MTKIYDRHGLKNDYGLPTDYTPAGRSAWARGRREWEAAWDRHYARSANRPAPRFHESRMFDRYHASIRDAAREVAEAILPESVAITVRISGRSLVAYLGGDRCVVDIDPATTRGPRSTAEWVARELGTTTRIDHGAAQSLGYLVGPHRPVVVGA